MIKLMNLKLPKDSTEQQLIHASAKYLHIAPSDILHIQYLKKSIDARKKPRIFFIFTVAIQVKQETELLQQFVSDSNVQAYTPYQYRIPDCIKTSITRPVVIGFGPAGMFAALVLAKAGLRPIVLERGACVEERQQDVALFRQTGQLNPDSNIQFGEGGAGTFSDGKLTTGIKDPRIGFVLETFVSCGAPEEILYLAKPHIGTDRLVSVVQHMRQKVIAYGGEIQFHACLENIEQKNNMLTALRYRQNGKLHELETRQCILATGHSARDLFLQLHKDGIQLVPKNFAIGVRIEHPQHFVNQAMYGREADINLPNADYKLAVHLPNGRSLYTFCMCPGGEVVAAASEDNRLVINGMSNYARNGKNANSALLVGISPEDLQSSHPLAGIEFQKKLEKSAFLAGGSNYYAPVCCVGDFLSGQTPTGFGNVEPTYRPGVTLASPELYLPNFVVETLKNGILQMNRKIAGFSMPDAILTGVESRSSSPVRIVRNESCESVSLHGLYPCGEGAGYAGGITSAAVDGIRCAEQLLYKLQLTSGKC